jgi:glycerophosphoryl diester phosphodiesterase
MSRSSLVSCLVRYIGYGWTGKVPQACRGTLVLVPINVAPWLWGWPNRFLARLGGAGSHVFVLGPYSGGEFSTGIDTQADIARLPSGYAGGIWTNDIRLVADAFKAHR